MGIKQFHLVCTFIIWCLFLLWSECSENRLGTVVILSLIRSGVARAQPMPGHSMGTLCLRVASYLGPAQLLRLQYGNAEATRGVWGMLPQKILEFLSFLGWFWGYFRSYRRLQLEHFDHAFATNLRARSVRSLRQTHTVKPPNRGHFGDGPFVPCREVVLFSEVLF